MKKRAKSCLFLISCLFILAGQMAKPSIASSTSQPTPKVSSHVNGYNEKAPETRESVAPTSRVAPSNESKTTVPRANKRTSRSLAPQLSPASQASAILPGQSSTLMADGQVLLLGGQGSTGPVGSAFLSDPKTGTVRQLPNGLLHARAWHTATTLPNGLVLIFGGIGAAGKTEKTAEVFDPTSGKFQVLQINGLTPRSSHTATMLTDGRLLVAGGKDESGETISGMEVWDFRSNQGTKLTALMLAARSEHTATMLADGTVLLWGGVNPAGVNLNYGEIFDPVLQTLRIQASLIQPQNDPQPPQLAASIPQNDAADVPADTLIAVRFSKPLNVVTVGPGVTLSGPQGPVDAQVTPAESGMLAFVSPRKALDAGTSYTLSLAGLADNSGQLLPDHNIVFTTAGAQNSNSGSGVGVVGTGSGTNNGGSSDPFNSPFRELPPLQAKLGVTALAGQVLTLDGEPLAKVSLEIDNQSAKTDGTGRFLLQPLTAGHHTMWIDGGTASTKEVTYGLFEVGIDITAGQTNVLSYTIWMTALDMAHAVTIPSPTSSEVVVSTPALSGLELHLPPQATILDRNGNVVTTVSITPIPVRQPPFPLPKGVLVPLYFTIQPGGACIQVANASGPQGARLYYPNTYHYPAGATYNFYNYDADAKGWYVYGQGRVSTDGSQVVPNPGVVIYEFTGAMVSNPSNAPFNGPKPPGCPSVGPAKSLFPISGCGTPPKRGEPVDLQTGLFVYSKTDLVLPDVIPIVLTRTYRPNDLISRAFGIGTNHPYDIFMVGDNNCGIPGGCASFPEGYTYQDLILPDGGRIHFTRTSPCTGTNGFCSDGDAVVSKYSIFLKRQ